MTILETLIWAVAMATVWGTVAWYVGGIFDREP